MNADPRSQLLEDFQALAPELQQAVLALVRALRAAAAREEHERWSWQSLAWALRGMEEEPVSYTLADAKRRVSQ